MSAGRLLVVAPDNDVRRSLVFALEASGFDVTERGDLPEPAWAAQNPFDCTVLDQKAGQDRPDECLAFCGHAAPVVLLAAKPVPWLIDRVAQIVETPVVEDALVKAVVLTMRPRVIPPSERSA